MSDTSMLPPEQKVIKCYHCGNETLMNKTGEHHWGSRNIEEEGLDFSYTYKLFACPVCHKVTLQETYDDEYMCEPNYSSQKMECYTEEKILYPVNSLDSNAMPQKIRKAFEAALKVRNIDNNVCLMALRSTLELILIDKGSTKWGLKEKIEEIAEKGILPEALKEASKFAKILGDSAAHGKEIEVDSSDVNTIVEFVEYIIEYLYVLPYKIESYKRKIEVQEDKDNG